MVISSYLQVDIKMSKRGYKCKPKKSKVRKWVCTMEQAIEAGRLAPGAASKLAGRLSWGSSKLFRSSLNPVWVF